MLHVLLAMPDTLCKAPQAVIMTACGFPALIRYIAVRKGTVWAVLLMAGLIFGAAALT